MTERDVWSAFGRLLHLVLAEACHEAANRVWETHNWAPHEGATALARAEDAHLRVYCPDAWA